MRSGYIPMTDFHGEFLHEFDLPINVISTTFNMSSGYETSLRL
jgi:hypothetical protein